MENKEKNAKCPFCGAELFVRLEKGEGFCTNCKKEFDVEKAIKLYKSVHAEQQTDDKKVARGEDYLEVERILDRAEFYFKNKNFAAAEKELKSALQYTNTDYRIYFGLVRVETKDLTDYKNESHKRWLDKAIDCADVEEKSVITRLYKDFYQVSALSDDEIEIYKKERNAAKKEKLEADLKELIPKYMKADNTLKTYLWTGSAVLAIGLAALICGLITLNNYVLLASVAVLAGGYVLLRSYFTKKKQSALFNAVLDIYDAIDSFSLSSDVYFDLLNALKNSVTPFSLKNSLTESEERVREIVKILISSNDKKATEFVFNNKVLNTFVERNDESDESANGADNRNNNGGENA